MRETPDDWEVRDGNDDGKDDGELDIPDMSVSSTWVALSFALSESSMLETETMVVGGGEVECGMVAVVELESVVCEEK